MTLRTTHRILIGIVVLIVLLLITIRVMLNTDLVRKELLARLQSSTEGLFIESIEGDLWREIRLRNVVYSDSSVSVHADEIYATYRTWQLIRRHLRVDSLSIQAPSLEYRTIQVAPDTTVTELTLPISLRIHIIALRNGAFKIDGVDYVEELDIDANASLIGNLPSLELTRLETRLVGHPLKEVNLSLSGSAVGAKITLDQLVLATGRTLIDGIGDADFANDRFSGRFDFTPLSWRDIVAFTDSAYVKQDLTMSLALSGSMKELSVTLRADSRSLRGFVAEAGISLHEVFALNRLTVKTASVALAGLTGEVGLPTIENIDAQYDNSDGSYTLRTQRIRFDDFVIQRFVAGGTFTADNITANGAMYPGTVPIRFNASSTWSAAQPGFNAVIATNGFDMRAIDGFEDFPTSVNLRLHAVGRSGDITAKLDVLPSTFNRAELSSLTASMRISNNVFTVTDAIVRSSILNGDFSLTQHLDNTSHSGNRLDAEFTLINLQPLAPVLNLDTLQAQGLLRAKLDRTETGRLRFDGYLDVTNVRIDSIRIRSVNSRIESDVNQLAKFSANLNLNGIRYGEFPIEHVGIRGDGQFHPDSLTAFLIVESTLNNKVSLMHEGDLSVVGNHIRLMGSRLDIAVDKERYRLSRRFLFTSSESEYHLEHLAMVGSSSTELHLNASMIADQIRAELSVRDADLSIFDSVFNLHAGLGGRLNLDADLQMNDRSAPVANVRAHTVGMVLQSVAIDSFSLNFQLDKNRLNLIAIGSNESKTWFDADLSLPFVFAEKEELTDAFFEKAVTGSIKVHPTDLNDVKGWFTMFGMEPISGIFETTVDLSGTAGDPRFVGKLHLVRSKLSNVPIDSIGLSWEFDAPSSAIKINSTFTSLNQPALEINGSVPFSMDMRTFTPLIDMDDNRLDVNLITRRFNLNALTPFLDPVTIRRLSGLIDGEIQLKGSYRNPVMDGGIKVNGAAAYLPLLNIEVSDIGMELALKPGRIAIEEIRARSNGVARLSGHIDLEGTRLGSVDLALRGNSIRVSDTRQTQLYVTLNTRLRGPITKPILTGTIDLNRGYYYLDGFGNNAVEDVRLNDDETSILDGIALYDNLEMEMVVKTERGFWVRNRSGPEINLELDGELDILKSAGGAPSLFGTMGTSQGTVTQLGKRFVLEKGELRFSGAPENPVLDIRSLYALRQPSDIRIWYIITGTAQKPIFSFESDPEMDQQDIVSYTVFNRPFQQLMSWEQSLSGSSSIGNLAVDLLVDRVGELAANHLGLDVVEIDNTRSSGNNGTTIKAGKYINDKLFIAIFQELGTTSNSQVILEYALRQNLNLILTGSDKRKSGLDIQWKYDY